MDEKHEGARAAQRDNWTVRKWTVRKCDQKRRRNTEGNWVTGLEGGKTKELPPTGKTKRNGSYTRLNKTPHMDVHANAYTNKQFVSACNTIRSNQMRVQE